MTLTVGVILGLINGVYYYYRFKKKICMVWFLNCSICHGYYSTTYIPSPLMLYSLKLKTTDLGQDHETMATDIEYLYYLDS